MSEFVRYWEKGPDGSLRVPPGTMIYGRIEQMEELDDALDSMTPDERAEFDALPRGSALASWRDGILVRWVKY